MSKKRTNKLGRAQAYVDHGLELVDEAVTPAEAVFVCPECGKPKLHVHCKKCLFNCKVCGFSGNRQAFFAWVVKENSKVPLAQRKALCRDRRLPPGAFRNVELGWDGEQWTIPCRAPGGAIQNIQRYVPGGPVKNTTGCEAGLLGGDKLAACRDRSVPVWVVEGLWDKIALEWLLRRSDRNDIVVGVPGALVFKDQWQHLFTKREDVRLVYDHDDPGNKGCAKAWRLLCVVGAKVRRVRWPGATPDGFDARDWVVHGWAEHHDTFPQGCLDPLEKLLTDEPPEGADDGEGYELPLDLPSVVAAKFEDEHPNTVNYHPPTARRASLFRFDGKCYDALTETTEQAELLRFLEDHNGAVSERGYAMARRALALLPEVSGPGWIGPPRADEDRPDADECLLLDNGLLHVPTRTIHKVTPAFFATAASAVVFDRHARRRKFTAFLKSLELGRKQERLLRQIAGYLLVADNRYQKFFVLHGAPRAGKGVLARLFMRLLGPELATSLSLASLTGDHCEAALVGRRLCVFPDERGTLPKRAMTLFLQVVGGDEILINPKYQQPHSKSLNTRFLICTNDAAVHGEDAAGAVADRTIAVRFMKSFRDAEDPELEQQLRCELPGILGWALDGYDDLVKMGCFSTTAESRDFAQTSREAASPLLAWLKETCDVGSEHRCGCSTAFNSWRRWAAANDVQTTNSRSTFARDLKAALPGCETINTRGAERRVHKGFQLKAGREGRFK